MCLLKRDDLQRVFEKIDRNGDGLVSLEELSWLLDGIGLEYHPKELEILLTENSSSHLNFEEFLLFCESILESRQNNANKNINGNEILSEENIMMNNEEERYLFEAFKVFDLNGDGFITSDELQSVLSRLGLWDEKNGKDCRSMIYVYDKNLDGVVDFDEFKSMMMETN